MRIIISNLQQRLIVWVFLRYRVVPNHYRPIRAGLVKWLLFIFLLLCGEEHNGIRRDSPESVLEINVPQTPKATGWMRCLIWFFFFFFCPHIVTTLDSPVSLCFNALTRNTLQNTKCVVLHLYCHGHNPRLPVEDEKARKGHSEITSWDTFLLSDSSAHYRWRHVSQERSDPSAWEHLQVFLFLMLATPCTTAAINLKGH